MNGKLRIDVLGDDENVHALVPVETLTHVADRLEDAARSAGRNHWHGGHAKTFRLLLGSE